MGCGSSRYILYARSFIFICAKSIYEYSVYKHKVYFYKGEIQRFLFLSANVPAGCIAQCAGIKSALLLACPLQNDPVVVAAVLLLQKETVLLLSKTRNILLLQLQPPPPRQLPLHSHRSFHNLFSRFVVGMPPPHASMRAHYRCV